MPKVLTVDGNVKIGAYRFPDRKKPCLCVEKGNICTVYGHFIDFDGEEGYDWRHEIDYFQSQPE